MAIDPDEYYGRQLLIAEEDAVFVEVYDLLDEQMAALTPTIDLWEYELTVPEFERIHRYYFDDHPEAYWIRSGYEYSYYTLNEVMFVYALSPTYTVTADEKAAYDVQLETATAELLEGINGSMSEEEREKIVHDRLMARATYGEASQTAFSHSLIGVMLEGIGVCESYARSFQYLMYRCGIQSLLVVGEGGGGAHGWNAVLLDGEWYLVDLTWNDSMGGVYDYYNVTSEKLAEDHTQEYLYAQSDSTYRKSYWIPECTATAACYFVKYATEMNAFDADVMADAFVESIQNGEGVTAMFRTVGGYTTDQLHTDFFNDHFWEVIDAINARLPAEQQLSGSMSVSRSTNSYYSTITYTIHVS